MNKKLIIFSLFFAGLLFTQVPLKAQTQNLLPELPRAGITSDSPFYFLDRWGEMLQEFFTFSDEGKARLQVALIGERVSEIESILGREVLDPRTIRAAFTKIGLHTDKATVILERLKMTTDTTPLAATLASEMAAWEGFLADVVENSRDRLKVLAAAERETLLQRMDDAAFAGKMEDVLRSLAEETDVEVGRPLEGFTVISSDVDVDNDTYSSTYRAEATTIVDLAALRDRIFAVADKESGDTTLDDDSLDVTYERVHLSPIPINGIELTPEVSVTISVTTNSPDQGMTSINYGIDITLETESEQLDDFLKDQLDEVEENLDGLSDEIEEQMEAGSAARKVVEEVEEGKQGVIDGAAEEGITIPVGTFDAFDAFLAQTKSALAAGNYQEARRLAEQAEGALDEIEKAAENLEKGLELPEEERD